jgi:starch synthase
MRMKKQQQQKEAASAHEKAREPRRRKATRQVASGESARATAGAPRATAPSEPSSASAASPAPPTKSRPPDARPAPPSRRGRRPAAVPSSTAADRASPTAARDPKGSARARRTATKHPPQGYKVLMVASEAMPFAKSGGLADVTGALPRALAELGHDVTLVVPRYRGVSTSDAALLRTSIQLGECSLDCTVVETALGPRLRAWLIDQPALYDREFLYGEGTRDYEDNPLRFALLSKAALTVALERGFHPHVVHAHDWHAGLVAVYLRTQYSATPLAAAATVLTIHNLSYQGVFDPSWIPRLGLDWRLFDLEALEYWGRISLLKGGVNFSDRLTTVSPRYAQEIQTPATGFGFDGIIRRRADVLSGILNGIDTEAWDPARDRFLPRPYSADRLDDKVHAKRAVLERFALPTDDATMRRPLVGMVSRMVDQKGLDLLAAVANDVPHLGALLVAHGTGEARYQDMWRDLAARWPDRIGVDVGFEEALAHLLHAGCDLMLMPSHFEPCGLNQMYSQRYGTVPLVRATGGLDDTVEDFDPATGAGTGFKFHDYEPGTFLQALREALSAYRNRDAWRRLQLAGMRMDFSWHRAARAYAAVYDRAVTAPRAMQYASV